MASRTITDHDLIRAVYQADGSVLSIARKYHLSESYVERVRDGVSAPEVTFGLTPGQRPEPRKCVENKMPIEELHERLAIASCLKRKHRGGCILDDENIATLLPLG